jgi:hypothetical protein
VYIYTNKPSKVLFALTKLLMTDEVTRIDGTQELKNVYTNLLRILFGNFLLVNPIKLLNHCTLMFISLVTLFEFAIQGALFSLPYFQYPRVDIVWAFFVCSG